MTPELRRRLPIALMIVGLLFEATCLIATTPETFLIFLGFGLPCTLLGGALYLRRFWAHTEGSEP